MIKAKCKYNMKDLAVCDVLMLHKRHYSILWLLMILDTALVFYGSYLGGQGIFGSGIFNVSLRIIMLVCLIFLPLYALYFLPKSQLEQVTREFKNAEPFYEFDCEVFTYKICHEQAHSEITLKYTTLYRAFELKNYFILLRSRSSIFIVKKSGIYEGDSEQLRSILENQLGRMFVSKSCSHKM